MPLEPITVLDNDEAALSNRQALFIGRDRVAHLGDDTWIRVVGDPSCPECGQAPTPQGSNRYDWSVIRLRWPESATGSSPWPSRVCEGWDAHCSGCLLALSRSNRE